MRTVRHQSPPLAGEMSRSDRGGYRSGLSVCGFTHPLPCRASPPAKGWRLGSAKAAGFVDDVRASLLAIPPAPHKIPPFHPHLPPPCHTCRTPAAGWTGNVPVRAGGRPLWPCRNVRQGERGGDCQRGSVGGPAHLNGRAGPAGHRDDLGPFVRTERAAAGQRTGPVAELAPSRMAREVLHPRHRAHAIREGARLRAGNRAKPFRRRPLSGADGPGSPRMPLASGAGCLATRPQAGKAKRQLPVGCGHHPAIIGPRTGCATPCMSL